MTLRPSPVVKTRLLPVNSQETERPIRPTKPRRLWRDKFRESLRGIKLGIRGHSSFFVHFFFAALVLATAIVLSCDALEWCVLLGCMGLVLTAVMYHETVERI